MGQIFVSYSRKDRGFVDDLVRDLSKRGLSCWIDREGIPGGEEWRRQIGKAISQCSEFLIVLSPESIASSNVKRELDFAESHGRRIIPLRYKPTGLPLEMELTLGHLQWIDFVEPTYEEAFAKLVEALTPGPNSSPKPRPKLVWWISGFYLLSGAYYLTAFILYLFGAIDASSEQTNFFKGLPRLELALGLLIAIVNMAAALVLFQLRAQAVQLFFIGLVLNTIYSAWVFFLIQDSEARLGTFISYGFSAYVLYYTYRLKQQRKLNHHRENLLEKIQHGGEL